MRLVTSEKNAHRIAVVLEAVCGFMVFFAALVAVLALLGRIEVSLTLPEGHYDSALLLEKDHGATSRFLFTSISNNKVFLISSGTIGFVTWLGVALMGILRVFPMGFCFFMLTKFFGNIAEGKVFVYQNAEVVKKAGFILILCTFITPFTNGFLIPALINKLSSNHMVISTSIAFTELFFGFVLLVMAYAFSYGLYLQDEVDHTL